MPNYSTWGIITGEFNTSRQGHIETFLRFRIFLPDYVSILFWLNQVLIVS